ncbi:hypothetical protein EBU71_20465, partial [bacterium]|nr:hypothetical protein [Candidatus Elulimicrobium humile]
MFRHLNRRNSQPRLGSNYYIGIGSAVVMTASKGANSSGVTQCNILSSTQSGITSNSYDFRDGGATNATSIGIMTVTYVDNWINKKSADGLGNYIRGQTNTSQTTNIGLIGGGGNGSWGGGGGGGYGYGSFTLNP